MIFLNFSFLSLFALTPIIINADPLRIGSTILEKIIYRNCFPTVPGRKSAPGVQPLVRTPARSNHRLNKRLVARRQILLYGISTLLYVYFYLSSLLSYVYVKSVKINHSSCSNGECYLPGCLLISTTTGSHLPID
jgi:hypothetical protein